MTNLEIGEIYSTKELANALEVPYKTFTNNKSKYLDNLSKYYQYKVERKGKTIFYTIIEKIADYEAPKRKNPRRRSEATIKKFISDTITSDPMQTASNINRIAWTDSEKNPSEVVLLGLKQSTTKEYIRLNLREMYGTQVGVGGTEGMIEKKVWCRLDQEHNCYIEMEPELVDEFYNCFTKIKKKQKKSDMSIVADYKADVITREEMRDKLEEHTLKTYQEGITLFNKKHGFYPIRVPVYINRAWLEENSIQL